MAPHLVEFSIGFVDRYILNRKQNVKGMHSFLTTFCICLLINKFANFSDAHAYYSKVFTARAWYVPKDWFL